MTTSSPFLPPMMYQISPVTVVIWRFPKSWGYPKSSKSWMTIWVLKPPRVTWGIPWLRQIPALYEWHTHTYIYIYMLHIWHTYLKVISHLPSGMVSPWSSKLSRSWTRRNPCSAGRWKATWCTTAPGPRKIPGRKSQGGIPGRSWLGDVKKTKKKKHTMILGGWWKEWEIFLTKKWI